MNISEGPRIVFLYILLWEIFGRLQNPKFSPDKEKSDCNGIRSRLWLSIFETGTQWLYISFHSPYYTSCYCWGWRPAHEIDSYISSIYFRSEISSGPFSSIPAKFTRRIFLVKFSEWSFQGWSWQNHYKVIQDKYIYWNFSEWKNYWQQKSIAVKFCLISWFHVWFEGFLEVQHQEVCFILGCI